MTRVWLDGEYVEEHAARIPIHDRGFLFGDAVYEVIPAYHGQPFRLAEHLGRLQHSLAATGIACPLSDADFAAIIARLLAEAEGTEHSVYVHVTRGVGEGRDAAKMEGLRPTVLISVSPVTLDRAALARGIGVALLEDIRWQRCDIKATALLGNILLRREALARGAAEALLLRDGELTEGSSSNVFALLEGELRTAPLDGRILGGITRAVVLELARDGGIPVREQALAHAEIARAGEMFICSSVREIVPVVRLDGGPVGAGVPGPVTLRIMRAFAQMKEGFRGDR